MVEQQPSIFKEVSNNEVTIEECTAELGCVLGFLDEPMSSRASGGGGVLGQRRALTYFQNWTLASTSSSSPPHNEPRLHLYRMRADRSIRTFKHFKRCPPTPRHGHILLPHKAPKILWTYGLARWTVFGVGCFFSQR
jgi:hypothetical protein